MAQPTTQEVLAQPLSPAAAADMGLEGRDYLVGEQITLAQRDADRLRRAGYLAPVGTVATSTYTGIAVSVFDSTGFQMPQRGKLKFSGSVALADDPINGWTNVTIQAITSDPTTPAIIRQSGNVYPVRASVTTDPTRTVMWIGTVQPNIGSGYAISGVDVWIQA